MEKGDYLVAGNTSFFTEVMCIDIRKVTQLQSAKNAVINIIHGVKH